MFTRRKSPNAIVARKWQVAGFALAVGVGVVAVGCGSLAQTSATPSSTTAAPVAVVSPPAQLSGPGQLAEASPSFATPWSAQARSDCPASWVPYGDPSGVLTLCSPANLITVVAVSGAREPVINISNELDGRVAANALPVAVAAAVSTTKMFADPVDKSCALSEPGASVMTLTIAGYAAQVCDAVVEQDNPLGPLETQRTSIPLTVNGESVFLNLTINWRQQAAGAGDLAHQIADTAVVN